MERYVDASYQRDGEEPRRWAFVDLAPSKEGGAPAVLTGGAFYPAASFRLHSRSALPFPSYLQVSRNHFNLDWVGERRLKVSAAGFQPAPLARVEPESARGF